MKIEALSCAKALFDSTSNTVKEAQEALTAAISGGRAQQVPSFDEALKAAKSNRLFTAYILVRMMRNEEAEEYFASKGIEYDTLIKTLQRTGLLKEPVVKGVNKEEE